MKYAGLVFANLRRNKLRSAFTSGAIALAVLLVCLLLTMPAGLDQMLADIASSPTSTDAANLEPGADGRLTQWMPTTTVIILRVGHIDRRTQNFRSIDLGRADQCCRGIAARKSRRPAPG